MIKNKKARIILVILFSAILILFSYYAVKSRQEFIYKKNTYTVNYLELKTPRTVSVADKILDYLPKSLTETNLLGEVRNVDFEYEVNGNVEKIYYKNHFYDYVFNDEDSFLKTDIVTISLVNKEREYRQEIEFLVTYNEMSIVPLVLNNDTDVDNIYIEIESQQGDFSAKVPATSNLKKGIKKFIESEKLLGQYHFDQYKIRLVNDDYLDMSDEYILSKIFDDSWEGVDQRWTDFLKSEFLKLPKELVELAAHEGLIISVEDFNKTITESDIVGINKYYNQIFTKKSYANQIMANYSDSETKIAFSTSHSGSLLNQVFTNEFFNTNNMYYADGFKDYEQYVYGTKKLDLDNLDQKHFFLKTNIQDTLYHEFGHFLSRRSNYTLKFTKEELISLTSKYDYGYKHPLDTEVIADGFAIYFNHEEYMKENLPEIQREVEGVLAGLKNDKKLEALKIIEESK